MQSRRIALVIAMVGVLAAAAPAAGAATSLPLPTSMAAVGDSITQAASSAGSLGADAPQNSWSTGTNTTVASHAQRLQALGATMSVANGGDGDADVQRRAAVRQRNIDLNAVLASVCSSYTRCRFDGNAVFDTAFAGSDVSGDYFHPSVAGQAKIAAATWSAGYAWFVEPPVLEPVRVGGLTASTAVVRSNWTATVTIAVASADGPVAGATVTGSWTGASGATICVTAADGRCSLASGTLGKTSTAVTLRVVGVSGPDLVYDATANVQTSITVARP